MATKKKEQGSGQLGNPQSGYVAKKRKWDLVHDDTSPGDVKRVKTKPVPLDESSSDEEDETKTKYDNFGPLVEKPFKTPRKKIVTFEEVQFMKDWEEKKAKENFKNYVSDVPDFVNVDLSTDEESATDTTIEDEERVLEVVITAATNAWLDFHGSSMFALAASKAIAKENAKSSKKEKK